MATLTLLRHAQAEPHAPTGEDIDRPLSMRGREQAKELGAVLRAHDAVPELVLCSSANRAAQTWKLSGLADGDDATIEVRVLADIYGADAAELLDLIREIPPEISRVLVVGHEPVMSHLARILAGQESDEAAAERVRTGISTATLAFLDVPGAWADLERRSATLTGLARPEGDH